MKLHELAAKRPTDNAKKVFESYFGSSVNFDRMTDSQARQLLKKVRGLINEHRNSPQFHHSERNSSYMKLVVLEQGLSSRIRETSTVPVGTAVGANTTAAQDNATMPPANPTVAAGDALKAQQRAQVKQPPANAAQDANKATKDLTTMAAIAAKTAQGVSQQNNQKTGTVQAGVQAPGTTMPPASTTGSMGESRISEGKIDPVEAHEILDNMGLLGKNFFTLKPYEVEELLTVAKKFGYRKSQNAPGSTGRMFFQYLSRLADGVAKRRSEVKESRKKLKRARMMEGSALYHTLLEDDLQQAQVVLAAQDMVDRVQKMLEDVTSMQFKDLPALVDQIKTQVGVNEATQFNDQVNSTLGTLVENLQSAKTGLEGGMGTLTGQAPVVPGEDIDELPGDEGGEEEPLPAELGGEEGEEMPLPSELGGEEEKEPSGPLGRARR